VQRRRDPSLDFLRDAAAHLLAEGTIAGTLVTWVAPFWGLAHPFRLQERVWLSIEWADGQVDREVEDYEPWVFVDELRSGHFVLSDDEHKGSYSVAWLDGEDRREALKRLHPEHAERA
jgi:hypothetical protein